MSQSDFLRMRGAIASLASCLSEMGFRKTIPCPPSSARWNLSVFVADDKSRMAVIAHRDTANGVEIECYVGVSKNDIISKYGLINYGAWIE